MPIYCMENDFAIQQGTLAAHGAEMMIEALCKARRHDIMEGNPKRITKETILAGKRIVLNDVLGDAAEALYCHSDGANDVPLMLARLWIDYLSEIYGRAEMSEEGRRLVMASQLEAFRMIQEATELMPKIFRNWKPWDSPEWDDEEEGDGIHRIELIEER